MTGAEGEPIAASIRTIGGDRVFAPEQPIAEGTQLVLEYSIQCIGGAPQTLPLTFEFMTSVHSEMEFNPGLSVWPQQLAGVDLVEIQVDCRQQVAEAMRDSCGFLYSAPPGVHTVEVSTHVVGATTQPEPVRLQVDVQCPDTDAADSNSDDEPAPSMPDQEMVGPSEPSSDAALPDGLSPDGLTYGDFEGGGDPLPEPAAAPGASGNGGGCALGSSGAQAWRGGLLALVAAVVLGRARRRSPRSQP